MKLRVPAVDVDAGDLRPLKRGDKVSVTVTIQTEVTTVTNGGKRVYLRQRRSTTDLVHVFTTREGKRT